MSFIHLHNHSHYSILEWLPKPAEYAKKAKALWMKAVALTDTSNIHWCHEFYKACKENEVKAILWAEIFVQSSLDEKLNHKLVLLAKNHEGFKNLITLISKASLDNPWTTAKIRYEDIVELKEKQTDSDLKLVCLSGPISWEIPYYILSWKNDDEIVKRINDYKWVFGEENYFLELIYHDDIPKQKLVTDKLIDLHKNYNLQVVATNNCYYVEKEDKNTQDVIQALWTWHEIENPDRNTLINGDYSFLNEEEMQTLFWFIPEAISNTEKIADMINIKFETGWILIPQYELPEEDNEIYQKSIEREKNETHIKRLDSSEWYLRYLSFKWLNWRFDYWLDEETIFEFVKKIEKPWLDKRLDQTSPEELKNLSTTYYTKEKIEKLKTLPEIQQSYIDRLEYELVVIHEMWFNWYFLIVADYINRARQHDVPVWPWRWSAAWSLMAFLSWITDLDPIKYDLLFERFLNPARISMPDIDTDFADDERDKVVEYCRRKYGEDHVAQICTFGTFAARAAVKDVWRVMWVVFSEMNELVKLIPEKPWTKLKWALIDSPEFKEAYDSNEKYKKIIDTALKIEWNVRQLWVHACAVIIAPKPMTNFTALQRPPKDANSIVTQYSAYPLEDLGLLKMDFLWLRNLTIIKRALKIIKASKWVDVDMLKIDTADPKAYKIFSLWETTWIFQFESDWMRKYLKDLSPDCFDDLIAMVSLYRPGPIAYIPTYIDRKAWREEIKYMTDALRDIMLKAKYSETIIEEQKLLLEADLKRILDVSYWIAVYQEQLMFIVQYMAWFSLWEADLLRRWIWKKKIEIIEQLKIEFIAKSESFRWYKPEVSRYIYEEMIQPAANYSFNKSHAACYAFISYQTAYLKAHYPAEFLTSLMVSDEENMERIVMEVSECESKWISILPPSVNESLKHFTYIDDKNIRFWLKAIKWIWDWPIDKIIEARIENNWNFTDLENFIEVCSKDVINKKSLEALILSWAMDSLWERWEMFESISEMIKFLKKDEKKKETSQIWLFDNFDNYTEKLELLKTTPFSFEDKLKWEKNSIWFYVSGHPLDWLQKYCMRRSTNTAKLKMSMEELRAIESPLPPLIRGMSDKTGGLEASPSSQPSPLIGEGVEQKNWKKETKKEERKEEVVQAVWVIVESRKIITKAWKKMIFLKCEWFDYDFEVVIFPKDVEKYEDKVEEDKIVIANWFLSVNFEYGRKSIQAKDLKIASLSMIREQAIDSGLFDKSKRYLNKDLNKSEEEIISTLPPPQSRGIEGDFENENFENNLDKKIEKNKLEKEEQIETKEFIITIPTTAKKEDLVNLKSFLEKQDKWSIKIFIDLKWQIIDTKISLERIVELRIWISGNL